VHNKKDSSSQQFIKASVQLEGKKAKKAYVKPEMKAQEPLERATTMYYYFYQIVSSKAVKESKRPVSSGEILAAMKELPVERWKYINHKEDHIGPYAEDFRELFGVGDGKTINVIDAIGVLMASVKALAKELDEVKRTTH
jgi:hypothetical protein